MHRSYVLPQNTKPLHMVETVKTIVRPASRELEAKHDYHHGEFGPDGYIKTFGHFDGVCLDGEFKINLECGYVLDADELPFWCFKSDHGSIVLYASGAIEIGEFVDGSALGGEIASLLNKLYSVNT